MRWLLLLVLALGVPAGALAHGGTSHSAEMVVDNRLSIGRDALTLTQLHTCTGKLATDLWGATDADGDGKISDAEWAKGVDDSRTVFEQWCRVEVDWKTVLPGRVDVKLASFPRTRPATFEGEPLVLEHVATYPTSGLGTVRNIALNCTSLNARTIKSTVRCEAGMRIETSSLGTVGAGGLEVNGLVQQDGTPDQFALVVRVLEGGTSNGGTGTAATGGTGGTSGTGGTGATGAIATGAPSAPVPLPPVTAGQSAELTAGVLLIFCGVYYLVSSAVAYGRARAVQAPGGLGAIAASFAVIFLGGFTTVHALVSAGRVVIRF